MDDRVAHKAEAEARGDVEREGHRHDGQEGGNRDFKPFEADVHDLLHHESTHDDEDRSGRICGHDAHKRNEEERKHEAAGRRDGGQARTAARSDARSAFEVGGGGRRAHAGGEHRADGVGDERLVEVADLTIGPHEAALAGQTDQHAHVVEEVDHRQREDDAEKAMGKRALKVHLHEDGGDVGKREAHPGALRKLRHAKNDAERRRRKNADEHGGPETLHHQRSREEEAEDGELNLGLSHVAERHEGTRVGNDQTGALHTDERNEGTDAHHDGELEVDRNGVHDELADARHREQEEDEAGNEHRTKTRLPGEAGGTADIVGEERRNAEAGGHAHGVSGPQAHQQGHRDRDENHAARGRIAGNAAVGEHGGNDEYEIAHRHEGGDAGRDFLRNRSAVLLEAEETFND